MAIAKPIAVSVDSVVLDDGEVVGPDQLGVVKLATLQPFIAMQILGEVEDGLSVKSPEQVVNDLQAKLAPNAGRFHPNVPFDQPGFAGNRLTAFFVSQLRTGASVSLIRERTQQMVAMMSAVPKLYRINLIGLTYTSCFMTNRCDRICGKLVHHVNET